MTYGNRNPQPTTREDEDGPFTTVKIEDPKTLYGVPIHRFSVGFAVADFEEPSNVRGVDVTMRDLADAVDKAGFSLQARELREAAREFSDERNN